METKNCPYCGEGIVITAKKCKHCGEWLEEPEEQEDNEFQEDYEPTNWSRRIMNFLLFTGIGWGLFHFGSWHLLFGTTSDILKIDGNFKKRDIIFEDAGVLLRINDSYYGFGQNAQFFDSPLIQWLMLGAALGLFYYALQYLIFGE